MADTKSNENTEDKEAKPDDDIKKVKAEITKYKLLKNVKYGSTPYKVGDEIAIKEEDLEEFKKVGAIKIE